jgi:hypothetical protein
MTPIKEPRRDGLETLDPDAASLSSRLNMAALTIRRQTKELARYCAISGLSDLIDGNAVIVPVQETAEQFKSGQAVIKRQGGTAATTTVNCSDIYDAMLAASPYRREHK